MGGLTVSPMFVLAAIIVVYVITSIQILAEYERGVIFRLGKLLPHPKGPGVVLVFRPIDRIVRISLRTVVHDVPPQDIITRDNVSVKVNAVVFFSTPISVSVCRYRSVIADGSRSMMAAACASLSEAISSPSA